MFLTVKPSKMPIRLYDDPSSIVPSATLSGRRQIIALIVPFSVKIGRARGVLSLSIPEFYLLQNYIHSV